MAKMDLTEKEQINKLGSMPSMNKKSIYSIKFLTWGVCYIALRSCLVTISRFCMEIYMGYFWINIQNSWIFIQINIEKYLDIYPAFLDR